MRFRGGGESTYVWAVVKGRKGTNILRCRKARRGDRARLTYRPTDRGSAVVTEPREKRTAD